MTFFDFFWSMQIAFIAPFLFGFIMISLYDFISNLWR